MTPQAGHLDIDKMYQCLAVAYYWPNMFRDVVKYIRVYDICQHTRVEQAKPWNNGMQSQKLRGPLLLSILWDLFRIVNRVPRNPFVHQVEEYHSLRMGN